MNLWSIARVPAAGAARSGSNRGGVVCGTLTTVCVTLLARALIVSVMVSDSVRISGG